MAKLPTASAAVVINIHLRLFILLPLYGLVTLVLVVHLGTRQAPTASGIRCRPQIR
jgi:hypothetical protein